ncbi:MAG: hypothetical protein E2O88_07000 [Bacteroidetes bacterium]|nr:MAG: hypothetical protein E2O88_07000 [Bacteroidota bacterium]
MKTYLIIMALLAFMANSITTKAQGILLGEAILVSTSPLIKDADSDAFKSFMLEELAPAWNKSSSGTTVYLLKADRGGRKGELLTVCIAANLEDRKKLPPGSPFNDKAVVSVAGELSERPSDFLSKPDGYTEYHLIGADQFASLPAINLLGIHYIKVKPDRAGDFEKLVVQKLHPAVGHLVNDMNLLYYKAVAGDDKGSYITIYAIESVSARERFWPTGGKEQDIVKQLFGPHKELALELSSYLVEDSYLGPETGAGAAYFESMEWTDYVVLDL